MSICNKCGIAHKTDRCPRWRLKTLDSTTRVLIRIGNRWPDCDGHAFVYFVDARDDDWILALDLITDEQSEVPLWTANSNERKWTRKPTGQEATDAIERLYYATGHRYRVVRKLR